MAREAKSLQVLESEIQDLYPGTTTWEEGDDKHKQTWSDHNENKAGVYCAKDIKSDGGMNLKKFVEYIIKHPHPNLRYVIFNRKIYQRKNNFEAQDYNGVNAHKEHVHVSVGNGPDGRSTKDYDSAKAWGIEHIETSGATPKPSEPTDNSTQGWTDKLMSELPEVSRETKGRYVNVVQSLLNISGAGLAEDGKFGDHTERETKEFQRAHGLKDDGIVGRKTWPKLIKGK